MELFKFPADLPRPVDDGQAVHLPDSRLPSLQLSSTGGHAIDIGDIEGWCIIYVYPMTGRPRVALPEGWDQIPGARGCTLQSCAFRDHFAQLRAFGAQVFGLSAQSNEEQQEAAERLHLPFPLLSDSALQLKARLALPTFRAGERELYKRLTLIAKGGHIKKVFYPVFPPNENAAEVLSWLQAKVPAL